MKRFFRAAAGAACLAVGAAAAASPPPPGSAAPTIIAPVPKVELVATRGNLQLDATCATATIPTLASDAACAERVGRGDSAATIELFIASFRAAPTEATVRAALPLLDRAIAKEHHPAALYLAGMLRTNGELTRPDYAQGVPNLEQAAAGGNPAAADLLAKMVLDGRGTPKDVDRAIRLYLQAASGGTDGSAVRAALLYLNGWQRPRDVQRGRQILEQAKTVGVRGADIYLAALDNEDKSHGYQIHPSADPAKIEVRDYKILETPELPPAFGFTDDFKQVHVAAYSDPAVLARLERDYATLPTPYLFELARRMAVVSPERARGYLFLAQLRIGYDTGRCADRETLQANTLWLKLVLPDLLFALKNASPAELGAAAKFALDREAALPADTRPWWVCYGGMSTYAAIADKKPPPLNLIPAAQWPDIRKRVRDALAQKYPPS